MGTNALHKYLTPGMSQSIKMGIKICQCYFIVYSIAPIIFLCFVLVTLWRSVLKLVYKYCFREKYKLPESTDSAFAVEHYANTLTFNTFIYVRGQTDISAVRDLWLKKVINNEKEEGYRPYRKLMWRLIQKYGFFTWEDTSDHFEIRDHVKYCPETGLSSKIYSEDDVLEAVGNISDDLFSPERPHWEVLFVPKVKVNKNGELHYAIIFRVYHAYMDGLSAVQLLQKLLDSEGKLALDPVKKNENDPSLLNLIGLYAQVLLLGPYTIYKTLNLQNDDRMVENEGPKFLSRTKTDISFDSIKLIRKAFSCTTSAILNSAISGAHQRAAARKGVSVSREVDFGLTLALLPYPNDEPQNRFIITSRRSPLNYANDPVKRLTVMNKLIKSITLYDVYTIYFLGKLVGYFPVSVNRFVLQHLHSSYLITNLPGIQNKVYINGGDAIEEMYGCPPIKNGIQFSIGVSSYMNKLRACWIIEKSSIIENKHDVECLVADFEKEIALLVHLAGTCINNN